MAPLAIEVGSARSRPYSIGGWWMLVTLEDAANYMINPTKAERELPEWQAGGEAVIMAAECRGPLMHARIGVLRALNRHVERA
jgi:hypothetical protein